MSGAAWVRLVVVGLGLALARGTAAPATAADPDAAGRPKTNFTNKQKFRVPFQVNPADRARLHEIQLWYSDDQGLRWEVFAHATPDQPSFFFKAPRDGEYWFTVRTQDTKGRLYPTDDKDVAPGLIVVVDTAPPSVTLQPRPRRGSQASVSWEITDKNPDPATLVLEYQADGAETWRRVPNVRPSLMGVATWDANTADALRVRAAVADRAGNRAQEEITLPEGLAADPGMASEPPEVAEPPPILSASSGPKESAPEPGEAARAPDAPPDLAEPPPEPGGGGAPPPGGPAPTLVVGAPRFSLKYEVEDAGPGGPAIVELWATTDRGQTWSRLGRDPDRTSPFPVDLGGEGVFGLKLVARSASGLGDAPPAPGEPPQSWVVVDQTPPTVRLDPPKLNAQAGKLAITWRATDDHLGPRPVVLSYRPDRPDAIWQQITGPIANTGRHEWALPANVAPQFHLRIDVVDTLDNRASAETGPVVIDRARPRSRIIGLDAGARAAGAGGRSRR